ncbi:MAG: tetratricopeptide repeat protein [Thermodesulfovibrionales bacterium]
MQTEQNTQQATAHYRLGVSHLSEKKIQQAFVEFHKALELNPNDKEVLNAIGITYLLHLDDIPKAIEFFERAVKAAPDYSEAYNNLGYSFDKTGSYEKAVTFFKKAISNPLYETADKAYYNLGNAYYRLGKYDAALTAFKEVLKREPKFGLPYMRMALCYNALGRYADAATAMDQAIKLDPVYNGSREKALEDFSLKKIRTAGPEEADIKNYIEILKY